MTSPSPSEFLTFHRRLASHPALRRSLLSSTPQRTAPRSSPLVHANTYHYARPLSAKAPYPGDLSTNAKTKTDAYPDDKHATSKHSEGDAHEPQSQGVKSGMASAREAGTGGHATEQRDSAGGKQKAKREHPEAPDPAIGMQDERGGRGA